MKKLMTIFGACLFVFALSSCDGDAKDSKSTEKDKSTEKNNPSDISNNCIEMMLAELNEEERPEFFDALNIPSIEDMADCICDKIPSMTNEELTEYVNEEPEEGSPEQEERINMTLDCMGFDSFEEYMSAVQQLSMENME